MLHEKSFTNKILCIVLFMFSLNIFNQSSLFLAIAFALVVVHDRGKLYISSKDIVCFGLILFAISFFVFSVQNGLGTGVSAIGCPMAYYIGLRIQNTTMKNLKAEKQLNSVTMLLVLGMTLHAVINLIYESIRFGGINSGAIHYDFFSLGEKTSSTGAATYLTLFAGVIFYLIIESDSVKKWIAGILLIVLAFIYNTILGGRTFFLLVGVAFIFSMILYVFGQKNDRKKIEALGKVLLICSVLSVSIAFVYIRHQDTIKNMFESTYLFHRISYANVSKSQDLISFFMTSGRGSIREQYLNLMFDYPWGGRKILNKVGFYAHELWLDIFDSAGIIPYIIIWIVTVQITICNVRYALNKQVLIKNRVLIMGITVSVTVQFFFEPLLTGSRALLFSYFLICGLVSGQFSRY